MRKLINLFFVLPLFVFSTSCTKDDINTNIVGEWELISWEANTALDLNKDSVAHQNLLEELACENNETLEFESVGVYSNVDTFNPMLKIALTGAQTNTYDIDLQCSEGAIGTAASYIVTGDEIIVNNKVLGTLQGDILYTYKTLNVYNEDFSEVIETIAVKVIYKKK
ncbi:hypothetical protein [Lacinutrix undariae]